MKIQNFFIFEGNYIFHTFFARASPGLVAPFIPLPVCGHAIKIKYSDCITSVQIFDELI